VGKPTTPPLIGGVRAILADRVLRTVTVASSPFQLGPGALAAVAAVFATAHGRPAAPGWLLTSVAVGGLSGSLWSRPAAPAHAARTVMFALIGVGAALALAAATTLWLVPTAALFALSGAFLGRFTGVLFTTRQAHAPEAVRAQLFTISAGLKNHHGSRRRCAGRQHRPPAAQRPTTAPRQQPLPGRGTRYPRAGNSTPPTEANRCAISRPACGRLATSDPEAPADKTTKMSTGHRQHIPQILVAVRQIMCSTHKYDIAYSR